MRDLICMAAAVGTLIANAGDIVLFDAAKTPLSAVSSQSGAKFSLKKGVLEIETKGNTGYPGVLITGNWDLSGCSRVSVEIEHRDGNGELPLTVRLDNPGADPGKATGVFVDRITMPRKGAHACTVALPPTLPSGRRTITSKLTGMRTTPFKTIGVVADLDAARVVGVAVYMRQNKLNWKWGIRRIVAHAGEKSEVPSWMKMTEKEFFPFIDKYGQFKYKECRARYIPTRN